MKLHSPFSALATTSVDALALKVLAGADHIFSVSEVHRLAPEKASREAIRLSLGRLAQHGIASEHRIGHAVGYSLNRAHLLAGAIPQIASAKQRLLDCIQDEVATWDPQPVAVWLFGSAARGEMTLESDIDLLFVTPGPTEQLGAQIGVLADRVRLWTGNTCNPLVYAAEEVSEAEVFREILKDGACLAGERSWLFAASSGDWLAVWASPSDTRERFKRLTLDCLCEHQIVCCHRLPRQLAMLDPWVITPRGHVESPGGLSSG